VVETLIDQWLRDHPEHPALPHLEDAPGAVANEQAQANASIGATDPGSILDDTDPIGVAADRPTADLGTADAPTGDVPVDEPAPAG